MSFPFFFPDSHLSLPLIFLSPFILPKPSQTKPLLANQGLAHHRSPSPNVPPIPAVTRAHRHFLFLLLLFPFVWILDFGFWIFDYGFWILDFIKGIMDFDVKLKVDVAFSNEVMTLVLDMKPCEKQRKEEEKIKKRKMKKTKPNPA